MTRDALQQPLGHQKQVARIHLYLAEDEATLLYAFTYVAWAAGTRITATAAAAEGDAAAVLNRAACKLYVGLRETVRSGL